VQNKKTSWLTRLQNRWKLDSLWQVLLVLLVFSCTGFTILYIKQPVFWLLGITTNTPLVWRIVIYLLTILPAYQITLLFYGFIFGQFKFFWAFEKKMLTRMRILKARKE